MALYWYAAWAGGYPPCSLRVPHESKSFHSQERGGKDSCEAR
jgi:hypothetical protein